MLRVFLILCLFALPVRGHTQEVGTVQALEKGVYGIGQIRIDAKTKTISVPVEFNIKDRDLEYILVHENGKSHESLLICKESRFNLQLALILTKFKASPEGVFWHEQNPEKRGKQPPIETASRLQIQVEWTDQKGKKQSLPLGSLLEHRPSAKTLSTADWVFTGSKVFDPQTKPGPDGGGKDLIGLYLDGYAVINLNHPDSSNDEAWELDKKTPEPGTKATLLIKPLPAKTQSP